MFPWFYCSKRCFGGWYFNYAFLKDATIIFTIKLVIIQQKNLNIMAKKNQKKTIAAIALNKLSDTTEANLTDSTKQNEINFFLKC